MSKRYPKILLAIGFIFLFFILTITISFINHKIQLTKEDKLLVPPGTMVHVNDHDLHIYTEGQGPKTLIFMAGGGTSSPVYDFKTLYSLLSSDYKIVVVEKSGYGFSQDSSVSRDLDTMLEETREGLKKVGINGPYVLMPHSMSGIEALYWAQKYPDEIKAIVGLDMAVPEAYDNYPINKRMLNLASFGASIGITRFSPSVVDSSAAINHGTLTNREKQIYRAIFYRRTLSKSMRNEVKEVRENASLVKSLGKPNLPLLLFASNGEETGWEKDLWIQTQKNYIMGMKNSTVIELNVSHYVHDIAYERIAKDSRIFIETLP